MFTLKLSSKSSIFSRFCACVAWPAFAAFLLTVPPLQAALSLGVDPGILDKKVEENVEEAVEEKAKESVEEQIEEQVQERVLSLGGIPATIENQIEQAVEEEVAENIEENVTEAVEGTIEDTIEETVGSNLEEAIEETISDNIEEEIVENVESMVEETVAENVEGILQADIEQDIEQEVEQNVAQAVETTIEQEVAQKVEQGLEYGVAESIERGVENEIDELLQKIESQIELDENRIHKNQWLVMAELEVFEELAKEGYIFDKVTDLPGIGMRLAEVAAPSSFDITEARQGVIDVVGSERVEVDLNHIYTAGAELATTNEGVAPRNAIAVPADTDELPLRIGMIDSLVNTSHPALRDASIEVRSFVSNGSKLPDFHGTAIASIIAGNTPEYIGLAPNAQIFAAAVFEHDNSRGEFASTVSLVRALDWLVSSGVDVVNISLAGPPNRLLEAALGHAIERDVMIVAAAGNGGPAAKPMYPAAYDSVVAVTAVDSRGKVFRLANRGAYLDLAAPGVDLQHARAAGGYTASSGTSFAVPFAATAAARIRLLRPSENAREVLNSNAKDLGKPGRDEVYGYGLLRIAPAYVAGN